MALTAQEAMNANRTPRIPKLMYPKNRIENLKHYMMMYFNTFTFATVNITGSNPTTSPGPLGGGKPTASIILPVPMKIILAPIELLGVIIKPFALLIRLYANIKAGHIVLMSIIAIMYLFENWGAKGAFLGLSFFLNLIELLVGVKFYLMFYVFFSTNDFLKQN